MRGRGVLAQIFGLVSKDESEDAALLLTERAPPRADWWFDLEIRCAMDAPLKWVFRPEWENDYDPWPDDESDAIC